MKNATEPHPDRERLLRELTTRLGERSRPVLDRLPTPELLYLSWREDLQERYADPHRGALLLEWEMSAVERGERACEEIATGSPVDWKRARALDVGCGDGGFLVAFARRGARAFGLDLSEGNIEGANERGRAWQLPIATAVGSAVSLAHPNACFDVLTCGDVLEHLGQPDVALNEIWRVLRPGGLLWLAAPTRYLFSNLWRDPHYGFFGISVLPRRAAAWYLARVRRALSTPERYEVERLPTYGTTIATLRRLGFEIVAGEYRPMAALRDPNLVRSRWKKRLLERLVAFGLQGPLTLAYRLSAELVWPLRLVCRKPR